MRACGRHAYQSHGNAAGVVAGCGDRRPNGSGRAVRDGPRERGDDGRAVLVCRRAGALEPRSELCPRHGEEDLRRLRQGTRYHGDHPRHHGYRPRRAWSGRDVSDFEERSVGELRVRIDRTLCVGFGDCITAAPDAFVLDDSGTAVFLALDTTERDRLLRACDACPVDAITVWNETGTQIVPQSL